MRKARLLLASLLALALAFVVGMGPAAAATSTYLPTQVCSDPSNTGMGVQAHIRTPRRERGRVRDLFKIMRIVLVGMTRADRHPGGRTCNG
jgi:hypothetical protein